MPVLEDSFPDRYAGSSFRPFVVIVKGTGGGLFDLTGSTATWTLCKVGRTPVIENAAHSNTPGVDGRFEFSVTAAQISQPGAYTATIRMIYTGGAEPDVSVVGLTILPVK